MRGITNIPMNIDVKDPQFRRILVDMREEIVRLRQSQAPLPQPTNFRGTALGFAALLEWTRSLNADFYEILWNTTPTVKNATVQGVGDSQRWVDNVGQVAITRYYWVRARRYSGAASIPVGHVKVITLGSAVGVTPSAPPPAGHVQVTDSATGNTVYLPVTGGGGRHNLL